MRCSASRDGGREIREYVTIVPGASAQRRTLGLAGSPALQVSFAIPDTDTRGAHGMLSVASCITPHVSSTIRTRIRPGTSVTLAFPAETATHGIAREKNA